MKRKVRHRPGNVKRPQDITIASALVRQIVSVSFRVLEQYLRMLTSGKLSLSTVQWYLLRIKRRHSFVDDMLDSEPSMPQTAIDT